MKIQTSRFGEIEIDEASCFEMICPILGYKNENKFILIEHRENDVFKWFQSIKTPELAFAVTFAGFFGIDYSYELPDEVQEFLEIKEADDVLTLNLVVIPHENPKAATINLLAPLVFNVHTRKGAQIVLANPDFKIDHPLFEKEAVC